MRKQNWPKRDPIKNYFPLPNEIYALGLSSTAIAVYGYLLHREDRKTYVDGRLGQMEDRMSSLLYKQAVEQDMVAGILADAYQFSEEDLQRRRAESVKNVKRTNGRVSLDQRVREAWEEGDEWQD